MNVVEHQSAEELQALFRQETNARMAKRVWIVWQARLGKIEPEITAAIELSRRAVQEWVRRYNAEGIAGLQDRPGRGRQPILSAEERQAVDQRVPQGPQDGAPCSLRGLDPAADQQRPDRREAQGRQERRRPRRRDLLSRDLWSAGCQSRFDWLSFSFGSPSITPKILSGADTPHFKVGRQHA